MIRRVIFALALLSPFVLFSLAARTSFAQGRINHAITSENQSAPPNGRDFWFCIPQNYFRSGPNGDGSRYFLIYITSTRNTTAYVQVGTGPVMTRKVVANKTTVVKSTPTIPEFPTSTELGSSGVAETRSIHIWSNDADLSVYFLSRALHTSDGMYCIPTTGWGTEYVVASYNGYPVNSAIGDLPSEFCVVANQDNTYVTITPTYDIRGTGPTNIAIHPKGQPFSQLLNKGECVQYQTTTEVVDGTDLTGTFVSATKPVGVIGASVCPNIPVGDPACDHILDMLPPIRTWAKNYFTAPFQGRKYGGDLFLVVGTKAGQEIRRNGSVAASLGQPYDFAFIPDITTPSYWTSDTTFMLVQYQQSKTHSDPTTAKTSNLGDPAMVVVNPAEQFGKKIVFQIPDSIILSGQSNFSNVLNILVPISHENTTLIDGRPLNNPGPGLTIGGKILTLAIPQKQVIPGTGWEVVYISTISTSNAGEGTHVLTSDTTIGLYIYGETDYDSYAWAGALGIRSPTTKDTLPPIAIPDGRCFCSTVKLYDNRPIDTKLSSMGYDSVLNMTFYPDTSFVYGGGADSSYYEICVIDSSKPAYI
ncbi:MAG TPA: IgGFc-binding protein, partial [Candidatus Kapabacteria bacterium]|nr:IgGFc-binding protein [Candidatus Kapabacteria bacterium]